MENEEMTNDEMIAIISADSSGEEIQFRVKDKFNIGCIRSAWQVTEKPGWDFFRCTFRVKPEPPHCYGHLNEDGHIRSIVWGTQEGAETARMNLPAESSVVKLILAPDEE